jgi:acetoin utilization deacetylase AcuC-like enzyme
VHHGNGAEHVFWDDPDVLTISIHQDGMFPPGSGDAAARGGERARGSNVNLPLPPGSGVGAYLSGMERVVVPAIEAHAPDLILVPCGFDAEAMDPLGRMLLHSNAFRRMTEITLELAHRFCGGRLVMIQEGGYGPFTTPFQGSSQNLSQNVR